MTFQQILKDTMSLKFATPTGVFEGKFITGVWPILV
jgi:hypothetical protein